MGHQQLYWSHERRFRQGSHCYCICSNQHGLIRNNGLGVCCQGFCQYTKNIGSI
ncbi:small ribosomal subunit protein uS14-like [Saccopteryx leptura]|uniref:small ribosomal subunit protein uS14-like n=1 Tax=Saccopteryx leptura TaxID=249018 RepID=UPI00339CB4F5